LEEVLVSSKPRFSFSSEASDRSGSSSPIREHYNPTPSVEHFVCIVNTSSLYFCFSADEVSVMHVIPLGCLHICQILWYLREFWHPVFQVWENSNHVLLRQLSYLQWWLQRLPLDPHAEPTLTLHGRLLKRMGCIPRRKDSVKCVGSFLFGEKLDVKC
jgi:hypothetical protein